MATHHLPIGRIVARLVAAVAALSIVGVAVAPEAVIGGGRSAYPARGLRDIAINGETVPYLGAYRLEGVSTEAAFSVGPGTGVADGTYSTTQPTLDSPRLDTLLFLYESGLVEPTADRSLAAAALAWWYSDTRRTDGFAIWSNPAAEHAPIGPARPQSWARLAKYSDTFPVGLNGRGVDFDVAEREVADLHAKVELFTGPWTLRLVGTDTVRLESNGRPLPGIPVHYSPMETTGGPTAANDPPALVTTDANGEIDVAETRDRWAEWLAAQRDTQKTTLPPVDGGLDEASDETVRFVADSVWVDAPGQHREWTSDRNGARLATATIDRVSQQLVVNDRFPATTSTTTTTTTSTTTTSPASTTTTVAATTSTSDANATATTTTATTTTTTTGPVDATTSTAPSGPSLTTTPQVAPPGPTTSLGGSGSAGTDQRPAIAVPVTGPSRVLGWILRFGDIVILLGVAIVVGTESLPQRKKTTAP